MSIQDSKKYFYWKCDTDFFDKHFVKLILSQKSGEKILLLFIKLMCEACVHGGRLRYSEDVPYTVEDLKAITNSDKDFKTSMDYLLDKGLVIREEDETFYVPYAEQQTGNETHRTRRNGAKNAPSSGKICTNFAPTLHQTSAKSAQETDTDTETDIETDIELQHSGAKMTSSWYQLLTTDERVKLFHENERSVELIDQAETDSRIKGKEVKFLYPYIRGYARNKEWRRK